MIPPPPTAEEVHKLLLVYALPPLGRYAPPVEDPTVEAIVGMRFYFSVDPSSYRTIVPEPLVFPGGWSIEASLTPGDIDFTAADKSATCQGPGTSGRTEEGRNAADQEGCYVIFTDVPEGGHTTATITTHWHIKVTRTNFEPAVIEWNDTTTQQTTIGIKELQAIVTE